MNSCCAGQNSEATATWSHTRRCVSSDSFGHRAALVIIAAGHFFYTAGLWEVKTFSYHQSFLITGAGNKCGIQTVFWLKFYRKLWQACFQFLSFNNQTICNQSVKWFSQQWHHRGRQMINLCKNAACPQTPAAPRSDMLMCETAEMWVL